MHFTELFIRRPVMTTLVMLAILLFGAMSYRYLPVSDLPNVDFPTIMVTANLPGASPETMASAVELGVVLAELAFGSEFVPSVGQQAACGLNGGGLGVVQPHGTARLGRNLGNATAHGPGPHNANIGESGTHLLDILETKQPATAHQAALWQAMLNALGRQARFNARRS